MLLDSKSTSPHIHNRLPVRKHSVSAFSSSWRSYRQNGFGEGHGFYWTGDTQSCDNDTTIQIINSIRYIGPRDTATPAVSVYSMRYHGGREQVVLTVAAANISIPVGSYLTSGRTSWTFFTGLNFDGNSTCIPAPTGSKNVAWNNYAGVVGSVARGCYEEATNNVQAFLTGEAAEY